MSFDQAQQRSFFSTTATTSHPVPAPTGLVPTGANVPYASGIIAPPTGPIRKKSKPTVKVKPSKQLAKSLSTPQLRGPTMSDTDLDKKRNKLGYQRISIACDYPLSSHCRRRKIRCLVADEDPEGRCQNCIRLKKECVFYPVDQQTAIDARSESSSRPNVVPSGSSNISSSPTHPDARTFEQHGHQFGGGFHTLPSSISPGGFQGIPITPSTALQPQGNYAPPNLPMTSHHDGPVSWSPPGFNGPNQPIPIRAPSNMPQQYHRYGTPQSSVDTAPFPGPPDQPQRDIQLMQGFNYGPDHSTQQWQHPHPHPPVRSMSVPGYANQDLVPPFHHGQHPSEHHVRQAYDQQQVDHPMMPSTPTTPAYHGHPPPYMMHPDTRSSSMPYGQQQYQPPQPHMQASWYGNNPAFTQGEEPRPRQPHG